jgi:voltage-gated potassium channel
MVNEPQGHAPKASSDEQWNALEELDEWLRTPMLVLSFLWLLLVVVELVWGAFDPLGDLWRRDLDCLSDRIFRQVRACT